MLSPTKTMCYFINNEKSTERFVNFIKKQFEYLIKYKFNVFL
jgi:hypothetical protein